MIFQIPSIGTTAIQRRLKTENYLIHLKINQEDYHRY